MMRRLLVFLAALLVSSPAAAQAVKIYLTSPASTWTVPSDYNPNGSTVEVIGAGGNGETHGFAGGGGAYAKISTFRPSGPTVSVSVGAQGSVASTWFNSTSTLLAVAGTSAVNGSNGPGGQASSSVGDVKFSGGNGAFGGGGGAAGMNGAGVNADGVSNGGAGDAGFGGAGGAGHGSPICNGDPGAAGTEWDATHGSGGGGGFGACGGAIGGAGGAYGGGGGGSTGGTAGQGGGGIIVITYTPRRQVSASVF